MLRRFTCKIAPTASIGATMRFARVLPQGFDFIDNKVVELDLSAPGETKPSMAVHITRHDEFVFTSAEVKACVVPTFEGEAGIAPGHEYEIAKLQPGTIQVETMEGATLKFVTAGGFAHINPAGSVDINCAEVIPVDDLDINRVTAALTAAQEAVKSAVSEKAKAVAEIEVSMLEAAQVAIKGGAH